MTPHTVKSYDDELGHLTDLLVRMGALAEAQLTAALDALGTRDSDMAARVVAGDANIDALEREVQHLTVRLLALRQPVASDLRLIVAAIKIASGLERVGDYTANIAKRSLLLCHMPPLPAVTAVRDLGRLAGAQLNGVLDAFVRQDLDEAVAVWSRDNELDDRTNALFHDLVAAMTADPRTITACTHLMFIAKNIERVGDHVTNIAEALHFVVKGTALTEARPKGQDGIGG